MDIPIAYGLSCRGAPGEEVDAWGRLGCPGVERKEVRGRSSRRYRGGIQEDLDRGEGGLRAGSEVGISKGSPFGDKGKECRGPGG